MEKKNTCGTYKKMATFRMIPIIRKRGILVRKPKNKFIHAVLAYEKAMRPSKPLKNTLKRPVGRRKPSKRGKVPSISKLMKYCDEVFSHLVREKGATNTEFGLMNRCYTCTNAFEVKRLHAGHYVSRMFKACRWDFDNSRPQCYACNIIRKGDASKFRQNLIREIGEKRVVAIEKLRDAPIKLSREYLEYMLQNLTNMQTKVPSSLKEEIIR